MWMKITLLLVGILLWDAAGAERGQSTLARSSAALMQTAPAQNFSKYVESGDFMRDLKSVGASVTASVSGAAAAHGLIATRQNSTVTDQNANAALADLSKANDTLIKAAAALEQERAERRAAREKRRAELRLSQEDVAKIAEAVNELYQQEKEAAVDAAQPDAQSTAIAPPAPGPVPSVDAVEKSAAALGPDILGAIVKASEETGANSGYLLHIALRESGLVLGAKAPTSSATGPFQFIQQTWFQILGKYGAKHKLDAEVALLTKQSNGTYKPVSDEARTEVLALRTDPYVAALMAGELTMENKAALTKSLGRTPAHGELYASHVLGAGNAVKLVETRDKAAATSAASILPSAAASNRWLFYTSDGKARSVASLFDELSRFMSTREVATVCKANLDFFKS
ncbi:MAG: hypothetical protein Q7T44_10185 [Parvibaculum sp.]|nr:hypothetical protein [Parvibaculum sp.]